MFNINKDNWQSFLVHNKTNERLKSSSQQNTTLFIQFNPREFGVFEKEEGVIKVTGGKWNQSPERRSITEGDLTAILGWLEYVGLNSSRSLVMRSIELVADMNEVKE